MTASRRPLAYLRWQVHFEERRLAEQQERVAQAERTLREAEIREAERAAKANGRGPNTGVGTEVLNVIFERDHGICGLCHQPVSRHHASADHILPRSRGGSDAMNNLQLAHKRCNALKGNRLPETLEVAELRHLDSECG